MPFSRYRATGILILAAALLLAAGAPSLAAVAFGRPFPSGRVGVARPPIGLLVLTTEGDAVTDGWLHVDGAEYSLVRRGNLVVGRLDAPLAPGRHTAQIHVGFSGRWQPIDRTWEFEVAPDALDALPAPGPEQLTALAEVNRRRREADLVPLRLDAALSAAAAAHARYALANPSEGLAVHDEIPGRPGFTGEKPWDRGAYFGYPWSSYREDIHFLTDHARAVKDWTDSVYHRFPITDPAARDLGYGFAQAGGEAVDVLEVANTGPPGEDENPGEPLAFQPDVGPVIVYPAPGQRDVPVRWDGNEIPDPYRLFPGSRPAGYPITVQFSEPRVASASVDEATLLDAAGQPVPFNLLSPANDPHIGPNLALLPVADLQPGRRYTVAVRGQARLHDGRTRPFSKSWWFTTAGQPEPLSLQPDIRVLLNGVPVTADAPPAIRSGRTLLPARALLETLGATLSWDAERRDVTAALGNRRLFLKIGNDRAVVDDREVLLDAPPVIAYDRTLLPVRFVAEAFGLRVEWNASTRTVMLFNP